MSFPTLSDLLCQALTNSRSNRLIHMSTNGTSMVNPLLLLEREASARKTVKRRFCCEHVKPEPSPHVPRSKRVTTVLVEHMSVESPPQRCGV